MIEERMKKLMGEFLDLSGVEDTREWHENLDHLEAIRRELNTLMGQFVEAWHDKHNPHIVHSGRTLTNIHTIIKDNQHD